MVLPPDFQTGTIAKN